MLLNDLLNWPWTFPDNWWNKEAERFDLEWLRRSPEGCRILGHWPKLFTSGRTFRWRFLMSYSVEVWTKWPGSHCTGHRTRPSRGQNIMEQLIDISSTLFVVKPEGGQQCFFDYFWLNQWGSMKTWRGGGGLRGTRWGLTPPPPHRQTEHWI